MTPDPPSSSEESPFPRRSRPNLGDIVKDSTEYDLWAFDDLDPDAEIAPPPEPAPVSPSIPAPRDRRKISYSDPGAAPAPTHILTGRQGVRVDIHQQPVKTPGAIPFSQVTAQDEFADLNDLDGPNRGKEAPPPELAIHPSLFQAAGVPAMDEKIAPLEAERPPTVAATRASEVQDEFSPALRENAKPVSLIPHLKLSKLEWVGLGALGAIFLLGIVAVFFNAIYQLPDGPERLRAGDFPVKGNHLTIASADTFWRPPVTEGENAETFRRGTQLLPVIEITSSGNPGTVRVIFRDEDGRGAGDVLTRAIQPGVPLQVAATAGFEDVGMHAAYRAGQAEPWTIEVFEAPSASVSAAEFKKLFEIEISTDRR